MYPSSHSPERWSDSRTVCCSRRIPTRSISRHEGSFAGEAPRRNSPQAELLEADPQHLAHGLGRVAPASVVGADDPPEFGLHTARLFRRPPPEPPIADADHQVADHVAVQLDHQGLGQRLRLRELRSMLIKRPRSPRQPLAHRVEPPELPRRLDVIGGRLPQHEPSRAHRPRHDIERRSHRRTLSRPRPSRSSGRGRSCARRG